MRVNIKSEFYPPFFVLGTIITSYILHAAIAVQVAEAETVSLPAGSDEKYADTVSATINVAIRILTKLVTVSYLTNNLLINPIVELS